MKTTRTLTFDGKSYHVTRLYTSGVGPDYTAATKDATGKEIFVYLSQDKVQEKPEQAHLYEACQRLFDDHVTYAKHIGSSSFWQSGKAGGDT